MNYTFYECTYNSPMHLVTNNRLIKPISVSLLKIKSPVRYSKLPYIIFVQDVFLINLKSSHL